MMRKNPAAGRETERRRERKMPVNCFYCGAPLEREARFCPDCGKPVFDAGRVKKEPDMDLHEYFAKREAEKALRPAAPARPAQQPRPAAAREPERRTRKSDRGLNIALVITSVLAVAVLTFLAILLFWDARPEESRGGEQGRTPAAGQVQPSPGQDAAATGLPILVPTDAPDAQPGTAPTGTPVPIIIPTQTPAPAPTYRWPAVVPR